MKHIASFALASLFVLSTSALLAQRVATPEPEAAAEKALPSIPGVTFIQGPSKVKLGSVAEINLPKGYSFVGPESLDKFFEATQNFRSGDEVGVVIAKAGAMYFRYEDVGYVKDDDKKELDADKLYKTMEEGQESSNAERKKRGWDQMKLEGWARKPYYDEKTNHLKWAFKISSSEDKHQSIWTNEHVRLLGRGGVMKITLASDLGSFPAMSAEADQLLTGFSYLQGQKYAEFRQGDKVAQYGLAALVVGGAGVAAAKMGLFAKLGVWIAKLGKLAVVGAIAIVAIIAKFFKKLTGRE